MGFQFLQNLTKLGASSGVLRQWTVYEVCLSVAMSLEILAIYVFAFGYADRNTLFLYEHLGAFYNSPITVGRYWMIGFVNAGAVSVILIVGLLIRNGIARFRKIPLQPVHYIHCLTLLVPFLCVGIPLVMTQLGNPVLPLEYAIMSLFANIVAWGIVFFVCSMLDRGAKEIIVFILDGASIVPTLLLFRAIELYWSRYLSLSSALLIIAGCLVFGLGWLLCISLIIKRFGYPYNNVIRILVAGAFYSYCILPLYHFQWMTPPHAHYITASSNFFPENVWVWILTGVTGWVIATLSMGIRNRICNGKNR